MEYTRKSKDIGIFILRIGIGGAFMIIHGWPKITGGPDLWLKLGGAMSNLGITFAPEFWGIMSAVTEFGGGVLIFLGLFTRVAAFFLTFNMIIATIQLLSNHLPWNQVIYPIEILSAFTALIFFGGGRYSLDYIIFRRRPVKIKSIDEVTAKSLSVKQPANIGIKPPVKTESKPAAKKTV